MHNFPTFPCLPKTNAKAFTAMRTRELGPSLWVTLLGYPGGGKDRDIKANVALIREEKANALFRQRA